MSAHNLPPVSEFRTNVTPESMHGKCGTSLVVRASLGVSKNAKILAISEHGTNPGCLFDIGDDMKYYPIIWGL